MSDTLFLHPSLTQKVQKSPKEAGFQGGNLSCHCATEKVVLKVAAQVEHNHACGCTKCWKPKGAPLGIIGIVPKASAQVTQNAHKLKVVDSSAVRHRYACVQCGVHMFGKVEKEDHPFHDFNFIHTELSDDEGWAVPTFAAFVSSLIEGGTPPAKMGEVRARLAQLDLPSYDCLSPVLMDTIATYIAKSKGVLAK